MVSLLKGTQKQRTKPGARFEYLLMTRKDRASSNRGEERLVLQSTPQFFGSHMLNPDKVPTRQRAVPTLQVASEEIASTFS